MPVYCCTKRNTQIAVYKYLLQLLLPVAISACFLAPAMAYGKPEGVNKPELLPTESTPVIDVANYLRCGALKDHMLVNSS